MRSFILFFFLFSMAAEAKGPFLGNAQAPRRGTLRIRFGIEPTTLNPVAPEADSVWANTFIVESLLMRNEENNEWEPALAASWDIRDGGKVFEYELRKNARWSDGQPVTAEDVKFSYDLIFDPKYPSAHRRPNLENVEKVEVLGPRRVRFTLQDRLFLNFNSVSSMQILPKHIYGDPAKLPQMAGEVHGSGPYVLERWAPGRGLYLKRNTHWWGLEDSHLRGKYPPNKLIFLFVADDNLAFEMLKRGQLDYADLSPEMYIRALAERSAKSPFQLQQVQNRYTFFVNALALNLRSPLFKDPRVREALALVVDRDSVIQKFFHGFSVKATGPWYVQSLLADPTVEPIPFDPPRALRLLKEAGWEDDGKSPILSKVIDGKRVPLRFTLISSTPKALRHLTFLKEDAAKAGMDIEVRVLGRTTFTQRLDNRDFEAADIGWGGGPVDFDPGLGWASKNTRPGGVNYVGFVDPRADVLIEKIARTFDFNERIGPCRELYRLVAKQNPFIFLLNENSTFYAYSNRVGRSRPFFNYDSGLRYMWLNSTKGDE